MLMITKTKQISQQCFLQKIQIDLTEIYHLKVNKKTEELKSLHHLDEKTAKKLKHHHLQ